MSKRKTWITLESEYNSKRNLRPNANYRKPGVPIRGEGKLSKLWRYEMRKYYGSKY
jgi:hypothetical protein